MMDGKGRLIGLGVGPGDPELITLKALRLLQSAAVVGYFVAKAKASKGHGGNAFGIIEQHLTDQQQRMPLVYPVTTEKLAPPLSYEDVIADFYDTCAVQIAAELDAGRDVAVICEGDPFFYGSYMYLHDRLAADYPVEVVPGVCSMLGCTSVLGTPLVSAAYCRSWDSRNARTTSNAPPWPTRRSFRWMRWSRCRLLTSR
jgi:precorrin-2/cobalt-factor-2 C20-methyltransferase